MAPDQADADAIAAGNELKEDVAQPADGAAVEVAADEVEDESEDVAGEDEAAVEE